MITLISFLVILSILVFVHEFGHFIVAKSAGVYVETFSIGMGPKFLKKQWGDTEYCLSAIPLGGYVKLKGENPDEEGSADDADNMMNKSVPWRFSIFLAGPVMNIVLAVILMSLVYYIGIQVPKYMEESPVIGWIEADSPAETSGLQVGDEIVTVGGENMNTWEQALLYIALTGGKSLDIDIERGGLRQTITVVPDVENSIGAGVIGIGPPMKALIGGVLPGYPAEDAGLETGDEIIAIDGKSIHHWIQMSAIIHDSADTTVRLTVLRDDEKIEIDVTPRLENERGYLGIQSQQQTVIKKYGAIESISKGIARCWELTTMTVDLLKRLVTLKASPKTVGGPIMIAQMSGQVVREGLSKSLSFMGLISLSLGIFNLLPIPILDGGQIFLLLVEILYRRPLKMKEREFAQKIGLLIIIPLMLFVFYNDIMRIVGW